MNEKIQKLRQLNRVDEDKIGLLQEQITRRQDQIKRRNAQIEEIRSSELIGSLNLIEAGGVNINDLLEAIKSGDSEMVQLLMQNQGGADTHSSADIEPETLNEEETLYEESLYSSAEQYGV